ncbi:MAG: hypothetical protein WD872_21505 [Pirellulaceae bacterium]
MRLALLGADAESLELVRWAVSAGGHGLVAAYDFGRLGPEVAAIAPRARLDDHWESLVLGTQADGVIVARAAAGLTHATGIADDERRADQLRKLAQAGVPMLVVHPACEAIVGFEIEMIRRDSGGAIVPHAAGSQHPGLLRLAELISGGADSPLGPVEQIVLEREQADRGRDAVLTQFARDASLLRQLVGTIQSVNATGPAPAPGRDPMGPKLKTLASLANLSVYVSGDKGLTARWSIGPALARESARLTAIGSLGKAVLHMPGGNDWSLEIVGEERTQESFGSYGEAEATLSRLTDAAAKTHIDETTWLDACRDQEAAEAIDRSLARGRTIELFGEQHTEEASFKGVMAMGGCLMLMAALGVLFVATVVEGLRLPLRDWAVWRYWPIYLLVPIAVFLLLQVLQVVVKKENAGAELRQLVGGNDERAK